MEKRRKVKRYDGRNKWKRPDLKDLKISFLFWNGDYLHVRVLKIHSKLSSF